MVAADRCSGMIWCDKLSSTSTQAVTDKLDSWFLDFGYPLHIRSNGGPQFRQIFDDWCSSRHILHQLSSPYHPQSNGHAENAVKQAKYLLEKTDANLRQFRIHLSAWRTTPRADGASPADIFFGRQLRRRNPLPGLYSPNIDVPAVLASRRTAAQTAAANRPHRPLPTLQAGDRVAIHDRSAARWGEQGTIISRTRDDSLSFSVEKDNGAIATRTRNHLCHI